jgi:hypothetical protein
MSEASADPPVGTSSIAATLLPPDLRLGHEKPLTLSGQRLEADHRHHSQQIPATESRTHRWAWCLTEEVWPS